MHDVINNLGNSPRLTIHIGATKYTNEFDFILDFSWYATYKNYIDVMISAFIYILFLWRLFIKLPGIISGDAGNIEVSDGHIYAVHKQGVSLKKWRSSQ